MITAEWLQSSSRFVHYARAFPPKLFSATLANSIGPLCHFAQALDEEFGIARVLIWAYLDLRADVHARRRQDHASLKLAQESKFPVKDVPLERQLLLL